MTERDWPKLRGITRLLHDGVREGTRMVERQHRSAASKPFDLLQTVPGVAGPTRLVRAAHDAVLDVVYGGIQGVNAATRQVDLWVVDQLERAEARPAGDGATRDSTQRAPKPSSGGEDH